MNFIESYFTLKNKKLQTYHTFLWGMTSGLIVAITIILILGDYSD